jgi:hypothetical protein
MTEINTHNLGRLDDLVDGESRSFEDIDEQGLVVCNVQGQIYALADDCSHADAPLSEGRLRGWHITCPPAWEGVPCYQSERVEGEVVVNLGGRRAILTRKLRSNGCEGSDRKGAGTFDLGRHGGKGETRRR